MGLALLFSETSIRPSSTVHSVTCTKYYFQPLLVNNFLQASLLLLVALVRHWYSRSLVDTDIN